MGTFAQVLQNLPGATFSNPAERGEYDSEGQAALTLTEFETWLATFVTEVYHQRLHSGLGMPPLQKYGASAPAPAWRVDERRLRLDFMPYLERTVQPYGIRIDQIAYYSDVLRRWINATDPATPKYKRKFTVRRDPRDVSAVYFYDPEAEDYFRIPYRDTSHPAISIWELNEIQRQLEQQGRESINEDLIFAAHTRMREIADTARHTTKAARRDAQRRRDHSGVEIATPAASATEAGDLITDLAQIVPFEIEEL